MSRPAHELRVMEEEDQLNEKIEKLRAFMRTPTFETLDPMDRHLLTLQLTQMEDYQFTLVRRMRRFKPVLQD